VRAIIGIDLISSSVLALVVASQPSITGKPISIKTKSGFSDFILSKPS
ncbi:uncharacterized protein METZ01_LOCUS310405, partial [marine metagenome]